MITKEDVLKRVSQEDIMIKYFPGPVIVNKPICNPFRNDKSPDCFFHYTDGILLFIDFARMEYSGDCFKIAAQATDCGDFYTVLKMIDQDFNLNIAPTGFLKKASKIKYDLPKDILKKPTKQFTPIYYKKDKLSEFDYNYWDQRGITVETLNKYNTHPAKIVWIGEKEIFTKEKGNPIYVYDVLEGKYIEMYRPFANKKDKFRNNIDISIIGGYIQLPKTGNILIITKSYKEVMLFHELGFNAITLHGESKSLSKWMVSHLRTRFNNIYVIYDNDEPGITNAKRLSDEHQLPYWYIPSQYECKDPTEFVFKYDVKTFLNELKKIELFNKIHGG